MIINRSFNDDLELVVSPKLHKPTVIMVYTQVLF